MNLVKKLVLVLALVAVGFVLFRLFTIGDPEIVGADAFARLGMRSDVRFVVRGPESITAVRVEIGQEGRWQVLLEDTRPERSKELLVTVEPRSIGLADGEATVRIEAQGSWFRSTSIVKEVVVDTVPPSLSVLEATRWIQEGGAGAARLKADGAEAVSLENGREKVFPCRRLERDHRDEWVCLFAIGVGEQEKAPLVSVATDDAGNETRVSLPSDVRSARFPVQTIHLSDPFLNGKVKPMLGAEGEPLSGVEAFRRINEGWRGEDESTIRGLGAGSASGLLWDGERFSRLRNGKSMARYGDFRRYSYEGDEVSTSRHLGYDLASVKQAEVPAAAAGSVVFAGPLKIYGNTVILDHGLGLMTLYSHLSEFLVQKDDIVLRDAPIARTGSTGFAFGDHLHFGVLVGGIEVNPLQWWDEEWIAHNVIDVLSPAFPEETGQN